MIKEDIERKLIEIENLADNYWRQARHYLQIPFLLYTIRKLLEKRKWQSIETAPINTSILVYYSHGTIELAIFDGRVWRQTCDDSLILTSLNLTHWMLLPEAPKSQKIDNINKEII